MKRVIWRSPVLPTSSVMSSYVSQEHRERSDIWCVEDHGSKHLTADERLKIRKFWKGLSGTRKSSLIALQRENVLRNIKMHHKAACSCHVCGRKRVVIEEELEVLYNAYYQELEHFSQNPSPQALTILEDDNDNEYEDCVEDMMEVQLREFGDNLQVTSTGLLTVTRSFLEDDGGMRFLGLCEGLGHRKAMDQPSSNNQNPPIYPPTRPQNDDDSDYFDEEDEEGHISAGSWTNQQRIDEGRRMFQIFAARMFEQRVLAAYHETVSHKVIKIAAERTKKFLKELEDEENAIVQKKRSKQVAKDRKKAEKTNLRIQKEEEAAAIVAKEAADAANKAAVEKAALEKIRKEEEQAKEKTRRAQQKIDDQIYAKKLAEEKAALKREMELARKKAEDRKREEERKKEAELVEMMASTKLQPVKNKKKNKIAIVEPILSAPEKPLVTSTKPPVSKAKKTAVQKIEKTKAYLHVDEKVVAEKHKAFEVMGLNNITKNLKIAVKAQPNIVKTVSFEPSPLAIKSTTNQKTHLPVKTLESILAPVINNIGAGNRPGNHNGVGARHTAIAAPLHIPTQPVYPRQHHSQMVDQQHQHYLSPIMHRNTHPGLVASPILVQQQQQMYGGYGLGMNRGLPPQQHQMQEMIPSFFDPTATPLNHHMVQPGYIQQSPMQNDAYYFNPANHVTQHQQPQLVHNMQNHFGGVATHGFFPSQAGSIPPPPGLGVQQASQASFLPHEPIAMKWNNINTNSTMKPVLANTLQPPLPPWAPLGVGIGQPTIFTMNPTPQTLHDGYDVGIDPCGIADLLKEEPLDMTGW